MCFESLRVRGSEEGHKMRQGLGSRQLPSCRFPVDCNSCPSRLPSRTQMPQRTSVNIQTCSSITEREAGNLKSAFSCPENLQGSPSNPFMSRTLPNFCLSLPPFEDIWPLEVFVCLQGGKHPGTVWSVSLVLLLLSIKRHSNLRADTIRA